MRAHNTACVPRTANPNPNVRRILPLRRGDRPGRQARRARRQGARRPQGVRAHDQGPRLAQEGLQVAQRHRHLPGTSEAPPVPSLSHSSLAGAPSTRATRWRGARARRRAPPTRALRARLETAAQKSEKRRSRASSPTEWLRGFFSTDAPQACSMNGRVTSFNKKKKLTNRNAKTHDRNRKTRNGASSPCPSARAL